MYKRFAQALLNLQQHLNLQRKMLAIVLLVSFIVALFCVGAHQVVMTQTSELLYESTRINTANVTTNMERALQTITHISYMLLADTELQDTLYTAKTDPSYTTYNALIAQMNSVLTIYQEQLKYYHVSYCIIKSDYYTAQNNYLSSMSVSDEIINNLQDTAYAANGQPVIVTDYSDTHGIFLARAIRQIPEQTYENVAVFIVCIDIKEMLKSYSGDELWQYSVDYSVIAGDDCIYQSNETLPQSVNGISYSAHSYVIEEYSGDSYFITKTITPEYQWVIYAFLPYDNVYHSLTQSNYIIFTGVVAALFGAFAFSHIPIRAIGRQIERIVSKMELFGNTQVLPTEAEKTLSHEALHSQDEIAQLDFRFNKMALSIQTLIQENYTSELLRKDAQLHQLKTQINPHFLYNTLDSINWRAKTLHENTISIMVEALADLLRASLDTSEQCTLQKELHLLSQYLKIQKIRYGDMLQFTFDIPPYLNNAPFPNLTLQPLIENAIRYAIEQWNQPCNITIHAQAQQNNLLLEVRNTGSQFEDDLLQKLACDQVHAHGFGIGLLNIQRRLQLQYGDAYGLRVYNIDDDTACACITLPYKTDNESLI